MQRYVIEDEAVINILRECGYFCERVHEDGLLYETECSFEHLHLSTLPNGRQLVRAGSCVQTLETFEQEERISYSHLFPHPLHGFDSIPEPVKRQPVYSDQPGVQYAS